MYRVKKNFGNYGKILFKKGKSLYLSVASGYSYSSDIWYLSDIVLKKREIYNEKLRNVSATSIYRHRKRQH